MKITSPPFFSKNCLDKRMLVQQNFTENFDQTELGEVKYLLFSKDQQLLNRQNTCFFSLDEVNSFSANSGAKVYLGESKNTHYFALAIDSETNNEDISTIGLREFATRFQADDETLGTIAQASSLLNWNQEHRFCSSCGGETKSELLGWRQSCSTCSRLFFPRLDSVVIMLAVAGEYCLLGSGQDFQNNRYSCLAGFMEPGETIEHAAARELEEEVGLVSQSVEYLCSQPWPFPATLMIGVKVNVDKTQLQIDESEIRDAKWLHFKEVESALKGQGKDNITLPDNYTIANSMLSSWVESMYNSDC